MQVQKLNTELRTKTAANVQPASRTLKQVRAKSPSVVNADHKTSSPSQKGQSGNFVFAGIAG